MRLSADGKTMLKVTIVNTRRQRRLILEGTLVQPWVEELKRTWAAASVERHARQLVVDLNDVTAISKDGEAVLSDFIRHGAKFSCCGVLTKYLLKQLTLKLQPKLNSTKNHGSSND
jgi:ABC-type transporter Mla MlaB component